jgi:amino acid transporter
MHYTHKEIPGAFRVPFRPWLVPILGILLCILLLINTTGGTAIRFAIWLGIGHIIYFSYGYWHSKRDLGSEDRGHSSFAELNEEPNSNDTFSNAPGDNHPLGVMNEPLDDEL